MEWITSPEGWMALLSLTVLEIVLGIDNIVFISVLVGRLPEHQRRKARVLGLGFAMAGRILLLLAITWIMRLDATLFTVFDVDISWRDLILVGGGLFLLAKATLEIHHAMEGAAHERAMLKEAGFMAVLLQIFLIDMVFSLDSVITAVGMAEQVSVMILAIVIAVLVMILASGSISRFVDERPTVRMLALSFLVLIGTALIAEGIDVHVPKGYIYFAMAFSIGVEMLNLRLRGRGTPVALHKRVSEGRPASE